ITDAKPATTETLMVSFAVGLATIRWARPTPTPLTHPESLTVAIRVLPDCQNADAGGVAVPAMNADSRKESPTASERRVGEMVSPPGGVTTTGFSRSLHPARAPSRTSEADLTESDML